MQRIQKLSEETQRRIARYIYQEVEWGIAIGETAMEEGFSSHPKYVIPMERAAQGSQMAAERRLKHKERLEGNKIIQNA